MFVLRIVKGQTVNPSTRGFAFSKTRNTLRWRWSAARSGCGSGRCSRPRTASPSARASCSRCASGRGTCCIGGCVEGLETACLADDIGLAGAGLHLGCDPDGGTGRWYALYVRSRHEKVVESGLRGKGYAAFSPFYRTKRKRVDRIAAIDVPLFPDTFFATLTRTSGCRF
jgi:Transcription termination factor nusG